MTKPKNINILQLYPQDMNIYGDSGNVLALTRRLGKYGYTPVVKSYNPGDAWPEDIDIVIGGGGQDSGQLRVQEDLQKIKPQLFELAEKNTPMLVICGLYQLFGHYFKTREGQTIEGIGLLDITTIGGDERLVGNIITESKEFGEIIGYENHSGQTYLGKDAKALAEVRIGSGNNNQDSHEGARWRNVIGSYLHGSLLPKNPQITDFLISRAVKNRYNESLDIKLDDSLIEKARQQSMGRPR